MPTTTEYHNNGIVKAITEFDGNYVRSGTRLEFDRHGPYVEYDNTGAASGPNSAEYVPGVKHTSKRF